LLQVLLLQALLLLLQVLLELLQVLLELLCVRQMPQAAVEVRPAACLWVHSCE
jgi:hypothetical protein